MILTSLSQSLLAYLSAAGTKILIEPETEILALSYLDIWKQITWSVQLVQLQLAWKQTGNASPLGCEWVVPWNFIQTSVCCLLLCQTVGGKRIMWALTCSVSISLWFPKRLPITLYALLAHLLYSSEWNRWRVETFSVSGKAEWQWKKIKINEGKKIEKYWIFLSIKKILTSVKKFAFRVLWNTVGDGAELGSFTSLAHTKRKVWDRSGYMILVKMKLQILVKKLKF